MNTQNKKQFEPVKLNFSKETVMVLNGHTSQNADTITVLIPDYPSKKVDVDTNCTSVISA